MDFNLDELTNDELNELRNKINDKQRKLQSLTNNSTISDICLKAFKKIVKKSDIPKDRKVKLSGYIPFNCVVELHSGHSSNVLTLKPTGLVVVDGDTEVDFGKSGKDFLYDHDFQIIEEEVCDEVNKVPLIKKTREEMKVAKKAVDLFRPKVLEVAKDELTKLAGTNIGVAETHLLKNKIDYFFEIIEDMY